MMMRWSVPRKCIYIYVYELTCCGDGDRDDALHYSEKFINNECRAG